MSLSNEKKAQLRAVLENINKKYSKEIVGDTPAVFIASEHPELTKVELQPTGIPEVDEMLEGGIPKGVVTNIHGSPWSGKSSFCLQIAGALTLEQKFVLWVNLEGTKLDTFKEFLEIDPNYLIELGPKLTGEQLINDIEDLLYDKSTKMPKGLLSMVIIDSINNLHPEAKEKAWLEGAEKIAQMGSRAKLMDDFLSRLYGKGMLRDGTIVMTVTQDRANIAGANMPMASKTVQSGGESLKYNAKVTLKLSRKIARDKSGQTNYIEVEKNSMTGCLGKAEYSIIYKQGRDNSKALLEKAKEFNYITPGDKKSTLLMILPGLGDIVIEPIKADKPKGIKGVTASTIALELIKENAEIQQCLKNTLAGNKPPLAVKNGFPYEPEVIEDELS